MLHFKTGETNKWDPHSMKQGRSFQVGKINHTCILYEGQQMAIAVVAKMLLVL